MEVRESTTDKPRVGEIGEHVSYRHASSAADGASSGSSSTDSPDSLASIIRGSTIAIPMTPIDTIMDCTTQDPPIQDS